MSPDRWAARLSPWLPPAAAVILALPGFQWTWLWDDFDFLGRAQIFRLAFLLPDPGSLFYRPLSREIYFSLVWWMGRGSPLLGHVCNAVFLGLATALIVSIGTRLADRRAGLFAGFAFAFFGASPLLVAWVSGVQDLLALIFALAAIRLQLGGRPWPAALALVAAMLSKEVAVAVLPLAAALPWILRRPPAKMWAHALPYLVALASWVAIHPGVRILATRGLGAGEAGHAGLGVPNRGSFVWRTLLTLGNVPVSGLATSWPRELLPWLAVAVLIALLGLVALDARRGSRLPAHPAPVPGAFVLAVLLVLGPALVTAGLVRLWAPYYSVMPAAGIALLIGVVLARLPLRLALPILFLYAGLGVWSRGASGDPSAPSETSLRPQSQALEAVRAGFASLYPELPTHAVALVSVASTGTLGLYTHIYRFQALRVWYRDPSIETFLPERRPGGDREEFLFRITPDLNVVEIDPDRCLFRSSGERPDPLEVSRPARTYAGAVAAEGDLDRAVRIQRQIARLDRGDLKYYDLRLVVAYLLAANRRQEAAMLLDSLPPFPRSLALEAIKKLYESATRGTSVEGYAFSAFGISDGDLDANRHIMRRLREEGYVPMAARFARSVLRLAANDPEALRVIAESERPAAEDRLTTPVLSDSL